LKAFSLYLKLFAKNKFLFWTFIVFLLFINLAHLDGVLFRQNSNGLFLISSMAIISILNFVIFLFLSYEYFYSSTKANLLETVQTINLGRVKLFLLQFGVMLLLNLAISLNFIIYNLIFYFSHNFNSLFFLRQILLHNVINYFIMQLIASLLGWVLAIYIKRIPAYMISIIIILLGSTIMEEQIFSVYLNFENKFISCVQLL